MFWFLTKRRRQSAGDVLMQITVRQAPADTSSDLRALGIEFQPVSTQVQSTLCEHAQVQILARLLSDIAQSTHLDDSSELRHAMKFPAFSSMRCPSGMPPRTEQTSDPAA